MESCRRRNGKVEARPEKSPARSGGDRLSRVEVEVEVEVEGGRNLAAAAEAGEEGTGRERLKRHRVDVAGRVWVPEMWGQEDLLKDWVDCSALDRCLFPTGIGSARKALVQECRRANSGGVQIQNPC